MNKEDLIYLAGFVDGEGCISEIQRWKRPSKRFEIRISNTNLDVLKWILKTFGGHLFKLREAKGNWNVCYQWYIADNKAKDLYKEIKPYLKIKNKF